MVQREIEVTNSLGIHARPAALIVQTASHYEAEVFIEKDGMKADAKSIMNVMMLAAAYKSKVVITANGRDEQEVVERIAALFSEKFNEE